MDKNHEILQTMSHNIQLTDRKNLQVNGIKKLENFNSEEFFIYSVMGYLLIKGHDLELVKLDILQGIITIKGKINSINYLEEKNSKVKNESIVSRLFK